MECTSASLGMRASPTGGERAHPMNSFAYECVSTKYAVKRTDCARATSSELLFRTWK
jgi:hypothetical protein